MPDALETAANAFAADMGGAKSFSSSSGREVKAQPEAIFGGSDIHDNSEEAGGDSKPPLKEVKEARRELKNRQREENEFGDEPGDDEIDEDEVDEDADEGEEDDEKKAKGDDEDDEILGAKFEVQINGEPVEVTVKEALSGYMRQETFSRSMNFVDQGRQAVIGEARRLVDVQRTVEEKLAEAEEILAALIPAAPDWDKEFAADPIKARNLQKTYDGFQAKLNEIKAKRAEAKNTGDEMDTGELRKHVATEARKFASLTKWGSAKDRDKDLSSMNRTAAAAGFSPKETAEVYDSRMLHILWKASKYDRMVANKPKPVGKNRQQGPANPGAGRNRTAPKGNDRAIKRLRQTGSVEAAIPVFQSIIGRR